MGYALLGWQNCCQLFQRPSESFSPLFPLPFTTAQHHRTLFSQTVKIWDPLTGEQKADLRGHENDVEVVVFAPVAAYAAIRELTGIPVREDLDRTCLLMLTSQLNLSSFRLEH